MYTLSTRAVLSCWQYVPPDIRDQLTGGPAYESLALLHGYRPKPRVRAPGVPSGPAHNTIHWRRYGRGLFLLMAPRLHVFDEWLRDGHAAHPHNRKPPALLYHQGEWLYDGNPYRFPEAVARLYRAFILLDTGQPPPLHYRNLRPAAAGLNTALRPPPAELPEIQLPPVQPIPWTQGIHVHLVIDEDTRRVVHVASSHPITLSHSAAPLAHLPHACDFHPTPSTK